MGRTLVFHTGERSSSLRGGTKSCGCRSTAGLRLPNPAIRVRILAPMLWPSGNAGQDQPARPCSDMGMKRHGEAPRPPTRGLPAQSTGGYSAQAGSPHQAQLWLRVRPDHVSQTMKEGSVAQLEERRREDPEGLVRSQPEPRSPVLLVHCNLAGLWRNWQRVRAFTPEVWVRAPGDPRTSHGRVVEMEDTPVLETGAFGHASSTLAPATRSECPAGWKSARLASGRPSVRARSSPPRNKSRLCSSTGQEQLASNQQGGSSNLSRGTCRPNRGSSIGRAAGCYPVGGGSIPPLGASAESDQSGFVQLAGRRALVPEMRVRALHPEPRTRTNIGGVAQLVRAPACRAGLCGFESHRHRP